MPTVLRVDGHRFFFYSNEGVEPPHIHVQKAEKYAKYWLKPIRLPDSIGYTNKEIHYLQSNKSEHLDQLLEVWYEHFRQ